MQYCNKKQYWLLILQCRQQNRAYNPCLTLDLCVTAGAECVCEAKLLGVVNTDDNLKADSYVLTTCSQHLYLLKQLQRPSPPT